MLGCPGLGMEIVPDLLIGKDRKMRQEEDQENPSKLTMRGNPSV
jgi:hypothetical protein